MQIIRTHILRTLALIIFLLCGLTVFAQTTKQKSFERIYLIHADKLMYDRTQFDGAQRAKGRVHFRQGVKQLYSDSAVYNDRTAKFEAFGNVRFVQGDTVDIRGNYLRYDGQAQVAYMTGHDVTLKHTRGTLVSDSVLYNVQQEVAEFFKGGKLTRGDVTLTAEHGKCFMRTDSAHFDNNVKLTSARGTITTNDMGYNMKTKWAHVMGPSNIIRKNNNIYTENAYYNEATGEARLLQRNVLYKPGNREMAADRLHYRSDTKEAIFSGRVRYDDKNNNRTVESIGGRYDENGRTFYGDEQMVFTDHKNNRRITTDKGNYNEASRVFTGERNVVFDAYKDSVRMTCDQGEYHERDSIFYGNGHVVVTDRKHDTRTTCDRGEHHGKQKLTKAMGRVNYYDRRNQRRVKCDRGDFNENTKILNAYDNVWFHDIRNRRMATADRADYNGFTKQFDAYCDAGRLVHAHDSINNQDMVAEHVHYNDSTGWLQARNDVVFHDYKRKYDFQGHFVDYNDRWGLGLATDSAIAADLSRKGQEMYFHADTIKVFSYYRSTDEPYEYVKDRKLPKGYVQDSLYRVLRGEGKVRSWSKDVQAVCDTLIYHEKNRVVTMLRDPIVWNENRQILGEEIIVYLSEDEKKPKNTAAGNRKEENGMKLDSIHVNSQALVCEQVLRGDTLHFNQVAAQQMRSYFRDGEIYMNTCKGNVCIVNYPLEKDSVILYQNYTETAALRMTLEKKKLQRIWAPAATGCLYPLGLAPRDRTYLENFAWFSDIRPVDQNDLLLWRGKRGMELKARKRRVAPLQKLTD